MIIIFINWPPIIDSTFFFDFFWLKIVEHCRTINFQNIHNLLKIHILYSILNIRKRYKADNFPNKSHMNFTKYSKQINIYSYYAHIYCVKHKSQKSKVKSQKSKVKSQKSKAQLNSQLNSQLPTLNSTLNSQLSTQLNSQLSSPL